jgi:hypothetical protein
VGEQGVQFAYVADADRALEWGELAETVETAIRLRYYRNNWNVDSQTITAPGVAHYFVQKGHPPAQVDTICGGG